MKFKIFLYCLVLFFVSCQKEKVEQPIYMNQSVSTDFIGNTSCIECHQKEFNDWKGSHHDKAMMIANDSTILGNFDDEVLIRKGQTHRFYKKNKEFYVLTDSENGEMKEYKIKYTFGFTPIQQYLVEFGKGRLQVLALTWDDLKKEWFYMADEVYKNQSVTHKNWLHWTNQAQNWNGMCAECHSTNLKKNYDLKTDSYQTTWSELNVSCEACHGPASGHLKWTKSQNEKWKNYGFQKDLNPSDNKEFVENCARCHSRRSIFEDYHYQWKSSLDHMIPSTVATPFYHSDGQVKEEDYVYGSFLQTKMYQQGVRCNDCHNVHSTKLKLEGNLLCTQCHDAKQYNTENHHHHSSNSKGAKCINCHMPGQYFMGRDFRRDHSFRIPRPDVSKKIKSPNACNQCHENKTVDWAIQKTEEWYGKSKIKHHGLTFYEADLKVDSSYQNLKEIIENKENPLIIRRTGLELLAKNYPKKNQELIPYLTEKEATLRYQGIVDLRVEESTVSKIVPLLKDSVKAIRIQAAFALAAYQELISNEHKESFNKSLEEYIAVQEYNYDFPTAKLSLANLYVNLKDYEKAEKHFKAAVKQDPNLYQAQLNLAYLYNFTNRKEKAVNTFKTYLEHNSEDYNTVYSLGLLLAEIGHYEEAVLYLEKAKERLSENNRVIFNLAKIYTYLKKEQKAENYFKILIRNNSENLEYYKSLFEFYIQTNNPKKAKVIAESIITKFPDFQEKKVLEDFINQS
ncbi:MAG: tetratricopeptide repeat protein [Flavobacteriales bacterium]